MASKRKQTLQVVHPNCAGVDIGKKSHYVAVVVSRFSSWDPHVI